jgi:hypothetical protein
VLVLESCLPWGSGSGNPCPCHHLAAEQALPAAAVVGPCRLAGRSSAVASLRDSLYYISATLHPFVDMTTHSFAAAGTCVAQAAGVAWHARWVPCPAACPSSVQLG